MQNIKQEMPELLTLKEACGILKCHPNTLRQWDRKGILVAIRFGERKDRRYKKEDILRFLNQQEK
ncbi:helix-turn-helix domain-containing protein [Patescibacteria group bacterium]|nr:helix-turn-helix domain-containing protein [Patescibacteria group bacterium]